MFYKDPSYIQINSRKWEIADFIKFEPDLVLNPDYSFEVFGPQGHWLSNGPDSDRISGEDAGVPSRQSYIDKELAGAYGLPDWSGFRVALLSSTSFNTWSMSLPAVVRENLKLAAMAENVAVIQALYDQAITMAAPTKEARTGWQTICDTYRIPLKVSVS